MDKNRPTGREKHVTAGSGSVNKKGSGLGTGPVGNVHSHTNSTSGGTGHLSGGTNKTGGTRAGGLGLGGVAILVIGFLLKSFFGGGSEAVDTGDLYEADNNYQQTTAVSETSQSQQADMSVAGGTRNKYTVIKGGGADTVTIMVYMCGTDLESRSGMATNDLNEMLSANFSDNINLIIYTGGCSRWNNNIVSSDRHQIYQIKGGKFIQLEDNMGTGTMVDPATLTKFIKYCARNFPANRNELIFWDHGGGSITGFGYDEKNKNAGSMTLSGIDTALSNGGIQFDFIGFDACLMATVENGLVLERYGDYMLASEETEPGVGWYYTNWLTKLSQNTSMPTVQIGKNIIDDFVEECNRKCRGQQTTLSIVDLAELKATVPDELTAFARSTNNLISNNEYKKVSKARKNTREFAQSTKIDQIDLVHFCENLDTKEGADLASAVKGSVKYNRTSSNMTNANGLAIYFPYQKTGKVSSAVNLFKKIGMNNEYSKCIQQFASTEAVGQVSEGGSTSPLPSLAGTILGGETSGGSSDLLMQMLGSVLSSGGGSSLFDLLGGRSVTDEQMVNYVADNYFDASKLVWKKSGSAYKIDLSEEQWDLVQDIELNVFVDDGAGYIDLGMDNVFEFDDNGALIGTYDNTWLAIDGNIVPYYHMDTVDYSNSYSITGYVPCFLNGVRAELLLTFDTANPKGVISGARYVYTGGETEAVAKNLTEVKAKDVIEPICDYYTYDGEYQDSYRLDTKIVLSEKPQISNIKIAGGKTKATYRFTDIYNQKFWTPVIK